MSVFRLYGEIREDGSATPMGRVCARGASGSSVADEGKAIRQVDVATLTCKVFFEDETTADSSPTVSIPTTIYDTLQTDSSWSQDAVGYNFAHDLSPGTFHKPGRWLVEYKLTTTGGTVAWLICDMSCVGVRTS